MFPAEIKHYCRPHSVEEALRAIVEHEPGEAMFIAGGQSLMQAIKSRMIRPSCLIDLQDLAELRGVRRDAGGLTLGAMTRYVTIAGEDSFSGQHAALRDAAAHVGDRQVRNRGTVGGSCCWNYLASCMPAVVLTLDGEMELLSSGGGRRRVPATEFFIAPLETARREDELLLAVHLPGDNRRAGSAYRKWGLVKDALPVVGVCVALRLDAEGRCAAARIGLSGLAAGAQRAPQGEDLLLGSTGDAASLERAFSAVAASVDAQADKWASSEYRRQLIRQLGAAVAATAFARARGEQV